MPLQPGARLGPYEIISLAGVGGMGEVYKSRDTRLDRTVAIKILPDRFASDPQFRERFDREARAISQLDHPHICALHDVGEHDGTAFLVMPFLDGETLADRLTKGALPIDQAIRTAIEIASALDRAHRSGIVHRDLKPGNIFLTKAGARLLDFGLAKSVPSVVAGAGLSALPTAPNLTEQGAILGTFQYMAPEQIEGREADARTDIFAFGVVLYEMVTGTRAFTGKTHASLISSILKDAPRPITEFQPLAPAFLDHIVSRCLAKDPDDRWQSASDLTRELRWISERGASALAASAPAAPRARFGRLLLGGGMALAGLVAGIAATMLVARNGDPRSSEPPGVSRVRREHCSGGTPAGAARGSDAHRGTPEPHGDGLVARRTVVCVQRRPGRSAAVVPARPRSAVGGGDSRHRGCVQSVLFARRPLGRDSGVAGR